MIPEFSTAKYGRVSTPILRFYRKERNQKAHFSKFMRTMTSFLDFIVPASSTGMDHDLVMASSSSSSSGSSTDSSSTVKDDEAGVAEPDLECKEVVPSGPSSAQPVGAVEIPHRMTAAVRYRLWSPNEMQTLLRMVSEKQPWSAIAEACHPPESGCRDKYFRMTGIAAPHLPPPQAASAPTEITADNLNGRQSWTTAETHALLRMISENRPWDDIVAECHHPQQACRAKYARLMGRAPPPLPGLQPREARRTAATAQRRGRPPRWTAASTLREPLPAPPASPPPPSQPQQPPPPPPPPVQVQPPPPPPQVQVQQQQPPVPPPATPKAPQLSPKDQQQFVANVNSFATKMCAKLDPKTVQLCNAMFQFLLTVLPDESTQ